LTFHPISIVSFHLYRWGFQGNEEPRYRVIAMLVMISWLPSGYFLRVVGLEAMLEMPA
jgi:hypothetical protein